MARVENKLLYTDIARASAELASLPFAVHLAFAPKGDGHPILFLPGFFGGDLTTHVARKFFKSIGYRTYGWGLGTNFGPSEERMTKLLERFEYIYEKNGQQPVSIVGHSLGGIYARELAKAYPDKVRRVITLGTPIVELDEGMDELRAAFEYLNPHIEQDEMLDEIVEAPPVPTTVIYTKLDGIVHYRSCKQPDAPDHVENIVVPGSHCGLIVNANAYHMMAERLPHAPAVNAVASASGSKLRSLFLGDLAHYEDEVEDEELTEYEFGYDEPEETLAIEEDNGPLGLGIIRRFKKLVS